jgi:hypothetical protein
MRPFLVVAHPGHELRIHGWVEAVRPRVFVLTDGSGRTGRSRIPSTSRVLAAAGAQPGSILGRLGDQAFYAAILGAEHEVFHALTAELVEALDQERPDYVVADALEGYNPAHDVCRYIVNAALALANRRGDRPIGNFDFPLVGRPEACPESLAARAIRLQLDEAAFRRKVQAARGYPELGAEVEAALRPCSLDLFRHECLRPVDGNQAPPDTPPYYERYGEKQVAAGHYTRVLRYREHILPLVRSLRRSPRSER